MPFTEESLKKPIYTLTGLKNIFNVISAHKGAVKSIANEKKSKTTRKENIMKAGRNDLLLDNEEYKKADDKKAYLRSKILEIQNAPFLEGSRYENFYKKAPDYSTDFGKIHIVAKGTTLNDIDPETGYVKTKKSEPDLKAEIKKYKKKNPVEKEGKEEIREEQPKEEPKEESKEESKEELEEQPKEEQPKKKKIYVTFKNIKDRKEQFNEQLNEFNELMFYQNLSKTKPEEYDDEAVKEMRQALVRAIQGMRENINAKDNTQREIMKEKIREYNNFVKKTISEEGKSELSKESLSGLKEFEGMAGKKTVKELEQYAEAIERLKKQASFESTEKTSVSQSAVESQFKTLSGDQDIGNVRAIGFIAPMEAAAREKEVIPPPSERAKSLRRFVNFRWVYSTQNSSLGYDSPFQKIEDQENRRKFNQCYLPTNKLPKPETQEDLDKAKSFNTYQLVPQQSLVGMMQPASELSFKTSTNPNARKITIDEKQFADTKLYNFEPTQVNIKPTNPFSAMYGMEAIDQIKRNPNNVKNTLEFSSVMYDDCPIDRIKRKYNKNIIA